MSADSVRGMADTSSPDAGVPLEPAATIVLADDEDRILLLRRNRRLAFLPDVHVFPGGRVVAADHALAARVAPHCERGAFRVAALRETFEETGVLLASSPVHVAGRDTWRARVDADANAFAALLAAVDARLDLDALHPVDWWRTPAFERRRYDTLFYAARIGGPVEAVADGSEAVSVVALRADEALARHDAGELPFAPPTLHVLHRIVAAGSFDAWRVERSGARVDPIEPVVLPDATREDRIVLALPGHAGHPAAFSVGAPRAFVLADGVWSVAPCVDGSADLRGR